MADPEMLSINKEFVLKYKPKPKAFPAEVISMMRPASRPDYVVLNWDDQDQQQQQASSDSESENDEAPQSQAPGSRVTSLFDALAADSDGEDDDMIMITPPTDNPGPSTSDESSSKRRKTY